MVCGAKPLSVSRKWNKQRMSSRETVVVVQLWLEVTTIETPSRQHVAVEWTTYNTSRGAVSTIVAGREVRRACQRKGRRRSPTCGRLGQLRKTGRVSSVSEGGRRRAAGRIAAMLPRGPTGRPTLGSRDNPGWGEACSEWDRLEGRHKCFRSCSSL